MFLERLGLKVDDFYRNSTTQSNLRMLHAGRIDFIVSGWDAFLSDAKATGLSVEDFEISYTVDSSDVSIAFHQATREWIVQKFQLAFDDIKAEGMYDQILDKYKSYEGSN